MKKFVSMVDINSVFSTVDVVDYVTVKQVSDTSVNLNVYLKIKHVSVDSDLHTQIADCCAVLGVMLNRQISCTLISSTFFGKISDFLANLFSRRL